MASLAAPYTGGNTGSRGPNLAARRCAQAMGHLLRALDTMSKHLGGEHLWTADVMHEIGSLHTAR